MAQDETPQNARAPARMSEADRAEAIRQLVLRRSELLPTEVPLFRSVFHELIDVHHDSIWNRLRKRGLQTCEAEEIVQESLVTLYKYILAHGFPNKIPEMLHEIAEGHLLNFVHRYLRSPESIGVPSSGSEEVRSQPDLDRALDLREMGRRIYPLLSREHQEVLTAVVINGLTHTAAADLLGIPEGTLKSRLIAGKNALRVLLEPLLPPSQRRA